MHKRLERALHVSRPRGCGDDGVEIDAHELSMLLEGLERKPGRSATRWELARRADEIGEIVSAGR